MATIVMTEEIRKLVDAGLFTVDVLDDGWKVLNDNFWINTSRKDFVIVSEKVFESPNVLEFFKSYLDMELTEDQLEEITSSLNGCEEHHELKVLQDFYLNISIKN